MIRIRPAKVSDSSAIQNLCLEGLQEHFPSDRWDEDRNPDLKDPLAYYGGRVLVAVSMADEIVGTGSLLLFENRAFISRISVRTDFRKQAIARRLVTELEEMAVNEGIVVIELETTATWNDICTFWSKLGYEPTLIKDGDQYFRKRLHKNPIDHCKLSTLEIRAK